MEYRPAYKCRNCGLVYTSSLATSNKQLVYEVLVNTTEGHIVYNNGEMTIPLLIVHRCEQDHRQDHRQLGVADLIGVKGMPHDSTPR